MFTHQKLVPQNYQSTVSYNKRQYLYVIDVTVRYGVGKYPEKTY